MLLRWIVDGFGFAVSLAGGLCAALSDLRELRHTAAPGWTSVAVLTLMIGGFIIVSTGVTGLYMGKVFEQVKGRPLYVIDRVGRGWRGRPVVRRRDPDAVTCR